MPYDRGLSTVVVTGRLSRNFKGLTGELNSNDVDEAFYVWQL